MGQIELFFGNLADLLWGDWLLYVLLGLGLLYTIITGGIQIRRLPFIIKTFLPNQSEEGKIRRNRDKFTSLQVLWAALGSCIGSGNIVGVSMAILQGGPGALFWMWVAAFLGMATKYGEIVLGICHRGKDEKGMYIGGPMYYIAAGLKAPWLGALVAILLFIQNLGGTLIQSNAISTVVGEVFPIRSIIIGLILAAIMVWIISGGLKRMVKIAEKAVPIMASFYVIGGLVVIMANFSQIPAMFASIFAGAFTFKAATGAAVGITIREAMRYGVARGLYSNEAGEGSAAIFHSSVEVDHPARQGIYGVVEVFIDTIVICSTTGFAVIISGVSSTHPNAITLTAAAFATVIPALEYVVSVSLVLFASTSLMSQWYFGHISLIYLKSPKAALAYKFIFPIAIILGSYSTIELVWSIQDIALGLLIIPNVIALVVLAPKVRSLTKEFFNPENKYIENS